MVADVYVCMCGSCVQTSSSLQYYNFLASSTKFRQSSSAAVAHIRQSALGQHVAQAYITLFLQCHLWKLLMEPNRVSSLITACHRPYTPGIVARHQSVCMSACTHGPDDFYILICYAVSVCA